MSPLFDTLQALLRQDSRFFAEDGALLRNAVCEAAEKLDPAPPPPAAEPSGHPGPVLHRGGGGPGL